MSQKILDWELDEARICGPYRYEIFKVVMADGRPLWKGFVVFSNGTDQWMEHWDKGSLRNILITLGQNL